MQIGRYEIVGELGRGGMAAVYLARAPSREHVVLKVPLNDDADAHERLRDEARVGLRLNHTHVVETLDLIEHEQRPVLVLSYVPGVAMYELRLRGPLPPGVVLRIGRQIADALDDIHHTTDERGASLGILHRDVTPGNIMLGEDGDARLIDLGIARSTESRAARTKTGCMRGTLRYLAPELFELGEHTHASDLWSLGLVLLEAAIGRQIFQGPDAEVVYRIVQGKPLAGVRDDELDPRLRKALEPLLEKDPSKRPTRARDAAAMLAMFEKYFANTQDAGALSVENAVAARSGGMGDALSSEVSTAVLLASASRVYVSVEDESTASAIARAEGFEESQETYAAGFESVETYVESYVDTGDIVEARPATVEGPPRLDATGIAHIPYLVPRQNRPATPGEAILKYAQQLRTFEREEPRPRTSSGEFSI
jgi:serine/threonine-protein kinase